MKRAEQLQDLSRDHHGSLSMAAKILKIVAGGESEELRTTVEEVQKYYNDDLEFHFQHEERTVFTTIFQNYPDLRALSTQLLKEHGALRMLSQRMTVESAETDLVQFAELLKSHTRIEERELFPLVEQHFNAEELALVLNYEHDD